MSLSFVYNSLDKQIKQKFYSYSPPSPKYFHYLQTHLKSDINLSEAAYYLRHSTEEDREKPHTFGSQLKGEKDPYTLVEFHTLLHVGCVHDQGFSISDCGQLGTIYCGQIKI